MIHSPVILSAAAVLLVAQLPGGLAGPAMAKKQWGGWSPSQPCGGEVYGRDQPWWIFASVTSGSWGSFTSQACETGFPSVTDSASLPSATDAETSTFISSEVSSVTQESSTEESRPESTSEATVTETTVETQTLVESGGAESTATATSSASASSSSSSASSSDIDAWLTAHNTVRKDHGANNLTWSDEVAATAQAWADQCSFDHSSTSYGENLAEASGDPDIASAVQLWANEASEYDPSNPTYSHFTQMVWKSTTELGCGYAKCSNIYADYGGGVLYVCNYNPAGNVDGEYADNVQA
ncbi:CAP domain-containing protein [Desarmillaria tabescens]|uniref:CAP domain-containing protein n=1 Tax=Armillaria tabescens TaxID=1929756 RepID=A0AA39NGU4_ARMTA|nr:CAP domain-containing protein [Desarmillaria tabescens]KAK0465392.1 CAP domain-containing protein [Desarmillaria tabescens]